MIFYEVLGTSSAPSCLVGTQADAKALARERGTSFEQVDVPTDKPGLMAYVNGLKAGIHAEMHRDGAGDPAPRETEALSAVEVATQSYRTAPPPDLNSTYEATDIEDFILNRASVNQASNILACLGTRFAEFVKGR